MKTKLISKKDSVLRLGTTLLSIIEVSSPLLCTALTKISFWQWN